MILLINYVLLLNMLLTKKKFNQHLRQYYIHHKK